MVLGSNIGSSCKGKKEIANLHDEVSKVSE